MEIIKYYIKQFIHLFVPLKTIQPISIFEDKNVRMISVFPSETFSMAQFNDEFNNEYQQCKGYQTEVPAFYTFIIENGICIVGSEEVYNQNGDVFIEINTLQENFQVNKFKSKLIKRKFINGTVCYLDSKTELNNNYGHFILEILPRIYIVEQSAIKPDYYILPINNNFNHEFYSLIGIDPNKILHLQLGTVVEAENLVTTSLLNNWVNEEYRCFTTAKRLWAPSWLKNVFKNYLKLENNKVDKLTYISRKIATNRHISNEDEIVSIAKQSGFEIYYLENLSIVEKCRLFQTSKLIVSIHGAGLGNLVFCNHNNTLLEILSRDFLDPSYRIISTVFKIKYHFIVGEPIPKENCNPITEDFYLNPKQFEISIQKLLNDI